MNKEEKEAIEILQGFCTDDCINNDIARTIVKLIEKQQTEIENRLSEIKCLYNFISIRENRIDELSHFKKEVIDIIKYADDTAEPTYWNIRNLLESSKEDE